MRQNEGSMRGGRGRRGSDRSPFSGWHDRPPRRTFGDCEGPPRRGRGGYRGGEEDRSKKDREGLKESEDRPKIDTEELKESEHTPADKINE